MFHVKHLSDKQEIRGRLRTDIPWSLYALADLDDPLFADCEWWSSGDALTLVYHGISIRPIVVWGSPADVRALLGELPVESGYLNLRSEHFEAARGIYGYRERHEMHRMILDDLRPREAATEPLGADHLAEIEALYATGDGGGIAFGAFQLETGFFRGIRRNGELVAVGGVHVVSTNESVAGVGNIFTRPDCRGQGLAQGITSAVTRALLDSGIETIGLNVEAGNTPAIRAYEKLGFRSRFVYFEGPAVRL
jgi:ribosomal protein S18 acetylase RimI-like enzyme